MYVCMQLYVRKCNMYVSATECVYVCVYVCACMCMYLHVYVCICTVCICMYVSIYAYIYIDKSYGQILVHGEGTSLSRVGPYRFCSGGTLYKPSWWYRFGYRFRVGPYQFCSNGNPRTLSILLWSHLILSDTHMSTIQNANTAHTYGSCRYTCLHRYHVPKGGSLGDWKSISLCVAENPDWPNV